MSEDIARAHAAVDVGRHEEAVRLAALAVAQMPNDPEAYRALGRALSAAGKNQEALEALASGLAIDPDDVNLHLLRSHVLALVGRYADALKEADEAAHLDPNESVVHLARGLRLEALDRIDEARAAYDQSLKFDPDDAVTLFQRGSLELPNKPKKALPFLERAVERDPNDAAILNNYGAALQGVGRKKEAQLAFRSAILIDPTLRIAKENAHNALKQYLGVGLVGASLLAFKGWKAIWLVWVGTRVATAKSVGVAFGVVMLFASIGFGYRWVSGLIARKRNPELYDLYKRLAADRKAGRL